MNKDIFRKIKDLKSVKTLNDDYLDWLNYANAGLLSRGNAYCFDYVVKNLPSSNPVLEIGSFCGLSINVIAYLLRKYERNNKIISCDHWEFEGSENSEFLGDSDVTHLEYREFIIDSFKRNVKFFSKSNLPYAVESSSDQFFNMWQEKQKVRDIFERDIKLGGKLSFVFVDGNHTYEYCKRDYMNSANNLEKGGFILFDDSSEYSDFECAELMSEIIEDENFELVMKNPHYLFKKLS